MSAISIRNLTRKFGEITAVDSLSLTVKAGEIFGLVGPDGAGKTTTLRILCGLMLPTTGEVQVSGLDVITQLDEVKDQIGYMAQKFGLYPDLTVEENMLFYADLFGLDVKQRDQLMADLLQMTRMEPFRKRPAAKLSGGMKQKLALMCTLLHHPKILFLDEPTNGVDPVSRRDFWLILNQLVKEGLTVLVTTAYLDEAEHCDRVALMYQGRLLLMDTPKALKESLPEACYELRGPNLRETREFLRSYPQVTDVELAGARLHVFLQPNTQLPELDGVESRRITPSLEDIFIATVNREGAHV
jgi:ABC-2 type transport system ATP-binding protein